MIRSLAFNLFFYSLTIVTGLIGIVLVPIPTPVLLRGLLLQRLLRHPVRQAHPRRDAGVGDRVPADRRAQ